MRLIAILMMTPLLSQDDYAITVTDKEVKRSGESYQYLIFSETEDGVRVFKNTDALIVFKFNSSDIQAKLKVGETYKVETIGFRVPFLSMYENITSVKEGK